MKKVLVVLVVLGCMTFATKMSVNHTVSINNIAAPYKVISPYTKGAINIFNQSGGNEFVVDQGVSVNVQSTSVFSSYPTIYKSGEGVTLDAASYPASVVIWWEEAAE